MNLIFLSLKEKSKILFCVKLKKNSSSLKNRKAETLKFHLLRLIRFVTLCISVKRKGI